MPRAIHYLKRKVYKFRQDRDTRVPNYYNTSQKYVLVTDQKGGSFGYYQGLVRVIIKKEYLKKDKAGEQETVKS